MKINAKLHKITNQNQFIASFVATNGKPTAGFTDFGTARIHLATDIPEGKFQDEGGFLPPFSLKTDADSKGNFTFNITDAMKNFRGYIIAYQKVGMSPAFPMIPSVPIFQPVYRSQTFKLSTVKETLKNIFLLKTTTADKDGFSQKQADEKAAEVRTDNKLDKVSFLIRDSEIFCRVSERGADVAFNVNLRSSTGHDLDKFIEAKAEDIDVDLPGPDFIVGICVSMDDIENRIRKIIKDNAKIFNDIIAKNIPDALKSLASFTIHQIRFPVTGEKILKLPKLPEQHIPTRSIVPDLTAGVPKKLF